MKPMFDDLTEIPVELHPLVNWAYNSGVHGTLTRLSHTLHTGTYPPGVDVCKAATCEHLACDLFKAMCMFGQSLAEARAEHWAQQQHETVTAAIEAALEPPNGNPPPV